MCQAQAKHFYFINDNPSKSRYHDILVPSLHMGALRPRGYITFTQETQLISIETGI